MKRRDFLKSSLLFAGVAGVAAKSFGLFNKALAEVTWVAEKKLGYKNVSTRKGRNCSGCDWYKAEEKMEGAGQCTLKAMQAAMKSKKVYVKDGGYCNMWKKKKA